jgi:DNA-binding transcriptional regulator GbsR (MarR family)
VKNQKSEEIKKVLEEVLSSSGGDAAAVEKVLQALDEKKIFRYHKGEDISLLSTAGRVLVSLADDPTMTIRAISVYLDLSETMIDKTVKQLIAAGLVTKTKVNRQNVYRLNNSLILSQPDIQQFLKAISNLGKPAKEVPTEVDDLPPF